MNKRDLLGEIYNTSAILMEKQMSSSTNTNRPSISVSNIPRNDNKKTKKKEKKKDENPIRGNWSLNSDYILSTLGYCVGLGNIWRFPYMCFKYGGGAFLIPYVLSLIFLGIPMFLIDVAIGQFCSNGPFTCWEYAPIIKGIGYAMVTISTTIAIYYNVILAYTIYYIFASMTNNFPWSGCNNTWNTPNCIYNLPLINCSIHTSKYDGTCVDIFDKIIGIWNETVFTEKTQRQRVLPADEYLNRELLRVSNDITTMGDLQWKIVLCLFVSWIIVFLCLFNGIKSSGKVIYFTSLFPYVVLLILFFRGITLDGSTNGIYYYIIPDLHKLRNIMVWKEAASQIFFSLSLNWGGLITLSSYNRFHTNIMTTTYIISVVDVLTSIFAGFVVFCYLGFLAQALKTTVNSIADQGMALAFIVYPEAVSLLPGSYIWSVLFYIMILSMGLSSQCGTVETTVTSFIDQYPRFLRPRKKYLLLITCILLFILGLPMTTQSGPYWLQLMDVYCGGWPILLIAMFEVISVGWIYGRPGVNLNRPMRLEKDIEIMTKKPLSRWWRVCWQYITPSIIVIILTLSWIDYRRAEYGKQLYPLWADILGWITTLLSLVFIPATAIFLVIKEKLCYPHNGIKQCIYNLTLPTYKWGPVLPKFRKLLADELEDIENFYVDVEKKIKYNDYLKIVHEDTNESNL